MFLEGCRRGRSAKRVEGVGVDVREERMLGSEVEVSTDARKTCEVCAIG